MRRLLLLTILTLLYAACDSIDCTINNVVTCNYGLYSSAEGTAYSISDTLTVTAEGSDSVLLNRATHISALTLPMSYWQETDTLHFLFYHTTDNTSHDVILYVKKKNTQHFESPDCPTTMFHQLEAIDFESQDGYVDSIVVVRRAVNYDSHENVKIYLHTAD